MLKSSCRDCSTKSSTDFAHYLTSDYLVPCGETHLTHSKIFKKIPNPPPPHISFQQVSCHLSIFLLSLGGNNWQFKF